MVDDVTTLPVMFVTIYGMNELSKKHLGTQENILVTDHIQAILMGRVDITQNKHYQHQAESQSYQTASLAINMLEKAYHENNKALMEDNQLSLFNAPQQTPSAPATRTEVSRRMAALSRSANPTKNTGVENIKLTTSIMISPDLNMEHNLKQNMQTFGETSAEIPLGVVRVNLASGHWLMVTIEEEAAVRLPKNCSIHLSRIWCNYEI